jgi:hypothetical protein
VASLWSLELPRMATSRRDRARRGHFGHSRLGRYGWRKFLSDWLGLICSRWWFGRVDCGIFFVWRGWHGRFHCRGRQARELVDLYFGIQRKGQCGAFTSHLRVSIINTTINRRWCRILAGSKVMLSASLLP